MNFARAATEHPAFARELPRLSPKCDVCFRPTERDAEYRETDEDEFHYESPARAAERVRQFATIKDLLTADTPGTSRAAGEFRIPSRLSTTNPVGDSAGLHRHRASARGGSNSWGARRADAKPFVEF
jgi:hypothetical protein